MRTFTVTCPECETELDVRIEEADLADPETNHTVVCEECDTETEYAYDPESDDLEAVDEEDEDETDDTPLVDDDEGEGELG